MDDLLARHRKEARELQNKITSKKKNATKKTRKGVNDECAELERALKERHAAELSALQNGNGDAAPHPDDAAVIDPFEAADQDPAPTGADPAADVAEPRVEGPADDGPRRKGNRQKARLARRAAEQEAVAERAAEEAADMPDLRAEEKRTVDAALRERGLVEHGVRSDGHCLYAAMADQLEQLGVELEGSGTEGALPDYKIVRREAAEFVLRHEDDFVPFLDEAELQDGVEDYARRIRDTAEWGGQMEILACARRWGLVVNVLQGDGRIERIEGTDSKDSTAKECWLAYYRHSFGLGEHYNSLRHKIK